MPGDKSISHRAAIIAALADGQTRIDNFSTSKDCNTTLTCLKELGLRIGRDQTSVVIDGVGIDGLRAPDVPLDCGNSGSTMRMLAGVLASQNFTSELTGDDALQSRPMNRIIEPLTLMGARIESTNGHAPLSITGRRPLKPITYVMPIASAQVKTAILFASLSTEGRIKIIETSSLTRDHTERMLEWFGVPVTIREVRNENEDLRSISITGPAQPKARDGTIPGDISSAAYFIAAAALLPSSELKIQNVGLNPSRTAIVSALGALNVDVLVIPNNSRVGAEDFNEPYGSIEVTGNAELLPMEPGRSNVLSGAAISELIDELPIIAVLGTQVPGGLTIRDAGELRVKESDRIASIVHNLRAMGAEIEEHEDGLTIKEQATLRGARLESFGDHRIAMAFTIAALIADGDSEIVGSECVDVSFPGFYELLESVVER
jgi:3-phosphoshikimate 1-carboxyvinyltransferase